MDGIIWRVFVAAWTWVVTFAGATEALRGVVILTILWALLFVDRVI